MKKLLHPNEPMGSSFHNSVEQVQQQVAKTLQKGQQMINDSVDGIKEAVANAKEKINLLSLPINNFLKDHAEMEKDFTAAATGNDASVQKADPNVPYCVRLDGKLVPAEQVLRMRMEENY